MDITVALAYAVGLIRAFEGFRATAYHDTLARPPLWTIGYGTTRIDGKPVIQGMICTRAQAEVWARVDMTQAAHFILQKVRVSLDSWQLGALISFCYNIGDGHFAQSTVLEALNLGLYRVAADRLLEYDEAAGKVELGLQTRRGRERAMFLTAIAATRLPLPVADDEHAATEALNQMQLDKQHSGVTA